MAAIEIRRAVVAARISYIAIQIWRDRITLDPGDTARKIGMDMARIAGVQTGIAYRDGFTLTAQAEATRCRNARCGARKTSLG